MSVLFQAEEILEKFRKRIFRNPYNSLKEDQFKLGLAAGLAKVLKAKRKKSKLVVAYTDRKLYRFAEGLADIGFVWGDLDHTFFGGDVHDKLHPYNALSELDRYAFDAVLGPYKGGIDLIHFFRTTEKALRGIKSTNFLTCLNSHKLAILGALVYLCPDQSTMIKVGSYQCGTSIFMAQLCKVLGKKVTIYACDTFEGMPAATRPDHADAVFYDSGMFLDNPIEKVQKRIQDEGLGDFIHLVKGDVAETLPRLDCKNAYMMFLDTDQYKETKVGLELARKLHAPHVIIDDTSLSGVNLAIEEFIGKEDRYKRDNLFTNFDYVFAQQDENSFKG